VKVVYVAGPIRADNAWDREQNIRRAEALALEVWRTGAAAICVHASVRFYDEAEARAGGWLAADLELLRRSDAVVMAEGWESSEGSIGERDEALRLGLPVFVSIDDLRVWLWGVQ
jgi:hypothetical protein